MGKTPKSRNPYVSSTLPRHKPNDQFRRSTRVAPARAHKMRSGHRGLAVALVGGVICIALVVTCVFVFPPLFTQFGGGGDQIRVELSEARVLSDFRSREIPAPTVTGYNYVDTSNLIGPRFDAATVSEAQGTLAADDVTRTADADAIWRNGDVTVTEAVELVYNYDAAAETWKEGTFREVGLSVKPNSAPNAGLFTNDLFTLLRERDPALAQKLDGATVKTESSLTVDGGTITETLAKQNGANVDNATVILNVTWSDETGWVPSIGDVQTSTSTVAPSVPGTPNHKAPDTTPKDTGANAEVLQL